MQHLSVTSPNGALYGSMWAMGKKSQDAALRRKKLKRWIDAKFDGNVSAAARMAGKSETQLIDTLRPNSPRSFGPGLARELEEKYGMPKYYLDTDDDAVPPIIKIKIGSDHFAQKLASLWDQLTDEVKGQIIAFALVNAATLPLTKPPAPRGPALKKVS